MIKVKMLSGDNCEGFNVLENQVLPVSGIGGGGLPNGSGYGERLYLASTMYPFHDIIYAPNFENCLHEGHNKNCIILYRGFVNYYGFSPNGNIMLVVDPI